MIEHYLQPNSTAQALQLAKEHAGVSTWFSGGSKLNAAPTKTNKTVAISLGKLALDKIEMHDGALHIGATCHIQTLIDHELTPVALKQAAGFIYSRHVRNQATLGGEIAAKQPEALLVPALFALRARVILADDTELNVEEYINADERDLIVKIIIPNPQITCIGYNLTRSAAGLSVITAAISIDDNGNKIIALDGVSTKYNGYSTPVRLRDLELQDLKGELLEQAVSDAIHPVEDLCGGVAYKRYVAGVIVTDLLAECQQLAKDI